jgi:hypothetical protein
VTITRRLSLGLALGASVLAAQNSWPQGIPRRVEELERQVGLLQAIVAELAGRSEPLAQTVDCGAGQTVGGALAAAANHVGPLVITVRGLCVESVMLTRDDVTLQGAADGDGLRAPSGVFLVLGVRNAARRVVLNRLTLDGNGAGTGLSVSRASDVAATDMTIRNSTTGVVVDQGGAGTFLRARIEDNSGNGIQADGLLRMFNSRVAGNARIGLLVHGRADVAGTLFEANGEGVWAQGGAVLRMSGGAVTGNDGTGVRAWQSTAFVAVDAISGNGRDGVVSVVGSSVEVAALIEHNGGNGIVVGQGSVVRIADNSIAGPTTIRDNLRDGVFVSDTSTLDWPRTDLSVTGNGGWGVRCAPSPHVAMVTGSFFSAATVSGNAAGQLDCPGLHLP